MPDAPSPAALTRADREQMLLSVDKLVTALVKRSGLPKGEHEDAEQEVKLLLWRITENFDPARGTKWSTYSARAATRMLAHMTSAHRAKRGGEVHPPNWARIVDPDSLYQEERDETADQLFDAVQRQLTGGLLDALTSAKPGKNAPTPALPAREIVEGVAFRGLTCDDLATQTGQHPKAVKTNLKNAIRKLKKKGLTQHVATDAQVEAILVPDPGKKHCNKPRVKKVEHVLPDPMKAAVVPAGSVPQERGCPPDPTEAAPCNLPA